MKYLILTPPNTNNTAAQSLILALKETPVEVLTRDQLALPFPQKTPPKGTPSQAWREACIPLIESLDAIEDLAAIILFDEPTLRALTATRVPRAPLIWVGALPSQKLPLYTAATLRLMTALLLPEPLDPQAIIHTCQWQAADPRTLPTCLPLPTTPSAWRAFLETLPQICHPTLPAKIEHALLVGELPFLGGGSRRLCYQLHDTGLCVKIYRRPQDFLPTTKAKVRSEIKRYAHNRSQNTSCQEYDYLQTIHRQQPQHLIALFPECFDILYLPSFGWSLIETLLQNADGTSAKHFFEVLNANTHNPALYRPLVAQLDTLLEELCAHTLHFYDFQNILTQFQPDGSIRLRIADFEPRNRQVIPFSTFLPCLLRRKMRRRYKRTFQNAVRPLETP